MTRRKDDESGLDFGAEDRRFFEAMAETYQPPPLTPVRRAAMRRGVDDRLAWRWRPRVLVRALATTAAGAVAAWLFFVAPSPPQPPPIAEADAIAWEETLFFSNGLGELTPDAEDEFLPDDYEAMATYFLEL